MVRKRVLKPGRLTTIIGVVVLAAPVLAACGATLPASSAPGRLNIAFFGFAKANSFANATYKGIMAIAVKHDATVTFFDPNFSATQQAAQIQDATVSGRYQVFIVQANDGVAVIPAVTQALAKGITVVAEYTPIGSSYDTASPQVKGLISIVEVPTITGMDQGLLAVQACRGLTTCNVAYLQGNPTYPPDTARFQACITEMATSPNIHVVSTNLVGGYTQVSGRSAAQDLFVGHKDVNVLIGSSQAIEGAYPVAQQLGLASQLKPIGNGGSTQAVDAVKAGQWFATIYEPEVQTGAMAAQYGLEAARGQHVPTTTNVFSYSPNNGLGTQAALANTTAAYSD